MSSGFVGDFPDAVAGAEIRYDTRNPDRYFDPSAFANPPNTATLGFVGNAARNNLIGPGISQFNVVLTKRINFTERVNLRFRSEFYNLFNRANFGRPNGAVFDSRTPFTSPGVNPTVGRITDTDTTSRQIQFSLKIEF